MMFKGLVNLLDDVLDKSVIFGYDRIGFAVRQKTFIAEETSVNLQGRVAVVTGANAGIGFATARALAERSASVVMVCRNPGRAEKAKEAILKEVNSARLYIEIADLAEKSDIEKLVGRLKKNHSQVDILINNAGVLLDKRSENSEGIEMTFAINTLGYYRMIAGLQPMLKKSRSARIINVSSGGMYLATLNNEDLFFKKRNYDGVQAYAETKRQEVIMTGYLAEPLKKDGILINSMHPGWVNTDAVKHSLPGFYKITRSVLRDPWQGADTIVWLAVKPALTSTGKFFFDRKERSPHRLASTRSSGEDIEKFMNTLKALA